MLTTTSFRRKYADALNIRGTRVSVQNAQLLTSTGSSTLDFFIGGGLPTGTLCLIEEDYYNTYSTVLVKYFLAEGITNNHSVFLTSTDKDCKQLLKELPVAKTVETSHDHLYGDDSLQDDLKIAWRYKNKSAIDCTKIESLNHGYDLSKCMSEDIIKNASVMTWDPSESEEQTEQSTNFIAYPYLDLLEKIKLHIKSAGFVTSSKTCDNILRIGICSVGSPLWNCGANEKLNIFRFLYTLKAVLRTSFAVAIVTVPSFLMQDKVFIGRLRQTSDIVIKLESFVGSDKKSNPLYKDYDGLLHVIKLPVLNTFMYQNPTSDLAFQLRRRGLLIERLHLPPDLEECSQEVSFGCSGQKHLDF